MQKTFPERVKGTKGQVFDRIPEWGVKDWIWWQYMKPRWPGLIEELRQLRVEGFWRDSHLLCVKAEGYTFYGEYPSKYDQRAYKYIPEDIRTKIPLSFFGICTDIVTRFKYPQAYPIAPPYSYVQRLGFSWHHTETIADMKLSPEDKFLLTKKFALGPKGIVFDVGAYIGYGTLGLSRMVSKGRVIAFECAPQVLRILNKNIAINKENILVVPYAAWKSSSSLSLGIQPEHQARSVIEGEGSEGDTQTTTIDLVAKHLELDRLDFISLSVNGAELEVLQGARNTLEKFKPNLSIAGWVYRDKFPVWKDITRLLAYYGYRYVVGRRGRILGWWA